jgi:hypothetical protein
MADFQRTIWRYIPEDGIQSNILWVSDKRKGESSHRFA